MTAIDLDSLLLQVIVHIKSHNPSSKMVSDIVAKAEFLQNMVRKKECTNLIQLMSYVFYISEVELNGNRGLN